MLAFQCWFTAEETAYHEAGHAVAGLAMGWKLGYLAIKPDTSGEAYWSWPDGHHAIRHLREQLVHLTAGPAAEYLQPVTR